MENYDILIKNCQVLNPDMSISSVQQMNLLIVLPRKHLMEKASLLCQV